MPHHNGAPSPPPLPPLPTGAPPRGEPTPPTSGGRGCGPSGGRGGGETVRKNQMKPLHWTKVTRISNGSLWDEFRRYGEPQCASEFDASELETFFCSIGPRRITARKPARSSSSPEKIRLIDLRKARNTEFRLTKFKMPIPDMVAATLAMDDELIDSDQVENCLISCPTKEEMEQLKKFTGDYEKLGKCEQYFLELMKVPRMEAKLRVFLFKIQLNAQLSKLKKSLNTVNSACKDVQGSIKLKEIMRRILYLGNFLNQGTDRGAAVGFKLRSLLKLIDTRASNSQMTLMHYLCKVLATKSPTLLDFHEDLVSLEDAIRIDLGGLRVELHNIHKELEEAKQELAASANDGLAFEGFHKTLKKFIGQCEEEVKKRENADELVLYFGENPGCSFEHVAYTLLNFMRLF